MPSDEGESIICWRLDSERGIILSRTLNEGQILLVFLLLLLQSNNFPLITPVSYIHVGHVIIMPVALAHEKWFSTGGWDFLMDLLCGLWVQIMFKHVNYFNLMLVLCIREGPRSSN